tara:strand:+ start:460 stop:1323 length:864 start_codon:yes stop_codon:yes gene_type:complete
MSFKGIISSLAAAFFFGLIPTFTKLSYKFGANTDLAIILRYTFAVIIIIVPIIIIKIKFDLIKKNIFLLFIISIGSICLTFGLLSSVLFIPVSLVALIFYTYPIVVLIYAILSKKSVNLLHIIGFTLCFLGLFLALGPTFKTLSLIGIGLAFLASIGAATVLISNELLSKHLNAITINVFTNVTCLVVFGIIIIYRFNIDFPSNNLGWSYIIFASLFYCVAFYSQLFAVNNMGSARTALLLYMEPIVAIFSAIILLNETLSMIQIIGVGLVITSLILTTRRIKNTIS